MTLLWIDDMRNPVDGWADMCQGNYRLLHRTRHRRTSIQHPIFKSRWTGVNQKPHGWDGWHRFYTDIHSTQVKLFILHPICHQSVGNGDTLILATWNIREFGNNRLEESCYYIAEIIDRVEGSAGGNEAMAIVYNTNKVQFTGLCGEIVLPFDKLIQTTRKKKKIV